SPLDPLSQLRSLPSLFPLCDLALPSLSLLSRAITDYEPLATVLPTYFQNVVASHVFPHHFIEA
ncbi:hypothetical protein ACLOJK_004529, partial [Asimina triloba]